MNHEFMEYMSVSYPDTPLSEFKVSDTCVSHGGLETLDDDEDVEDDEQVFERREKISRSEILISLPGLTFDRVQGHGIVDRIQGHGTPEGLHLDDFITTE